MNRTYQIRPIGVVHTTQNEIWIDIAARFHEGLLGLEKFSHITVLYWFDRNDTPQQRRILQVHPRKNPANPLAGVFATHAPVRPNPIAITVCKLLAVQNNRLYLDTIDALDGSPVIDIKGYIPCCKTESEFQMPSWVKRET
ncbi:MAG: tRNA (N6-threonylcarbamoyladenosine(37)-N6)-methyltransferase TrmO [Desulfobacteraceae bacterium]|nr:MAG: tRNA (N6-threonylcarbamoyladenosine(37)-N6)-methyltransferase TrmO [Desulfobacteraceae bacterium]